MRAISSALKGQDLSDIVEQCVARGKARFPKALPNIHDANDQLSDFLYGVTLGMKKVKKGIGDPIEFLTRNGIFYLRTRRYRALGKRLVFFCECGKKLKGMKSKPCHGTMDTRIIQPLEMCVDFDHWIIQDMGGGLRGRPAKAVYLGRHEGEEE